jgi:hypothetical protein
MALSDSGCRGVGPGAADDEAAGWPIGERRCGGLPEAEQGAAAGVGHRAPGMTIQTNDRICSVGATGHMGGAHYAVTARPTAFSARHSSES